MNALTSPRSHSLDLQRSAQRPVAPERIPAITPANSDWMERLAVWAERQPAHHRMGHWERLRFDTRMS